MAFEHGRAELGALWQQVAELQARDAEREEQMRWQATEVSYMRSRMEVLKTATGPAMLPQAQEVLVQTQALLREQALLQAQSQKVLEQALFLLRLMTGEIRQRTRGSRQHEGQRAAPNEEQQGHKKQHAEVVIAEVPDECVMGVEKVVETEVKMDKRIGIPVECVVVEAKIVAEMPVHNGVREGRLAHQT